MKSSSFNENALTKWRNPWCWSKTLLWHADQRANILGHKKHLISSVKRLTAERHQRDRKKARARKKVTFWRARKTICKRKMVERRVGWLDCVCLKNVRLIFCARTEQCTLVQIWIILFINSILIRNMLKYAKRVIRMIFNGSS